MRMRRWEVNSIKRRRRKKKGTEEEGHERVKKKANINTIFLSFLLFAGYALGRHSQSRNRERTGALEFEHHVTIIH
jgi:hypothetical protein